MKHTGESGGGNDKRQPDATSGGEGGPHPARGATNLCHSALGLCAALRPMAALAACGRREAVKPLSAKSGHENERAPPKGATEERRKEREARRSGGS